MAVAVVETVGGFSYGFDFEDQRIDIDASLDTVDVGNLYAAIKGAQDAPEAMPYELIAAASGLDVLSPGIQTFLTVRLFGSWEVNSLKTSGRFTVLGGNLIRDDNADPFRDNPLITYQLNLSQAGVVADGGAAVPTVADIAGAVWSRDLSNHPTAGTAGRALGDVDAATSALPDAAAVADAVWDEAASDHTVAGSTGEALVDTAATTAGLSVPTAAAVAAAVHDRVIEGTLTLTHSIRLLLAALTGNATGLTGGAVEFRSVADDKARITGTVSGGTRTVSSRDGT